jgi:hypothetical protein
MVENVLSPGLLQAPGESTHPRPGENTRCLPLRPSMFLLARQGIH